MKTHNEYTKRKTLDVSKRKKTYFQVSGFLKYCSFLKPYCENRGFLCRCCKLSITREIFRESDGLLEFCLLLPAVQVNSFAAIAYSVTARDNRSNIGWNKQDVLQFSPLFFRPVLPRRSDRQWPTASHLGNSLIITTSEDTWRRLVGLGVKPDWPTAAKGRIWPGGSGLAVPERETADIPTRPAEHR